MLLSGSDSVASEVHFFHCQSMMSEITDDLEMIKSSFIKLPVTFLSIVWSYAIHTDTDWNWPTFSSPL